MRMTSDQPAGNKELIEMLGHALKEAETPKMQTGQKLPGFRKEFERRHIPASVLFHYRNHPQMLHMVRGRS
jgi:hypothetical protein